MLFTLVLIACGSSGSSGGELRESFADQGVACRDGDGLVLDFGGTYTGTCEELANGACSAVLEGDTLTVTGSVDVVSTGSTACDDIALDAYVDCDLPEGVTDSTIVAYAGAAQAWADLPECDLFAWR